MDNAESNARLMLWGADFFSLDTKNEAAAATARGT
jgi:hypothetical protein